MVSLNADFVRPLRARSGQMKSWNADIMNSVHAGPEAVAAAVVGLLETDSAVQVTDINIDSVKDSDITQKAKF